jgi:hypothetical protein
MKIGTKPGVLHSAWYGAIRHFRSRRISISGCRRIIWYVLDTVDASDTTGLERCRRVGALAPPGMGRECRWRCWCPAENPSTQRGLTHNGQPVRRRESNVGFGANTWPTRGPGEVYARANAQGETLAQQANVAISNANNLLGRHAETAARGPPARRARRHQHSQVN